MEMVPEAFFEELPDKNFEVCLSDLTETVYAFLLKKEEKYFVDLQKNIRSSLDWELKTNKELKSHIFLLDNMVNAIYSKCVTRIIDRKKTCFTNEELVNLGIYEKVELTLMEDPEASMDGFKPKNSLPVYQLTTKAKHAIVGEEPEKYWMTRTLRTFIEEKVRDIIIETVSSENFKKASIACSNYYGAKASSVSDRRAASHGIVVALKDVPKRKEDKSQRSIDKTFDTLFDEMNNGMLTAETDDNSGQDRGLYIMGHCKEGVRIHCCKPPVTGEADIETMNFIDERLGSSFLLKSKDSDWPLIVLLNMEKFIDVETGDIPIRIMIDRSHAFMRRSNGNNNNNGKEELKQTPDGGDNTKAKKQKKKVCYIDVVALWRGIISYFKKEYPEVKNPVETMVAMMMFTGTDFVYDFGILERYMTKTEKLVALKSQRGGHSLINDGTNEAEKTPSNIITPAKVWSFFKKDAKFRKATCPSSKSFFVARNAPIAGDKMSLKTVLVNETRLYHMALYLYLDHYKKHLTDEEMARIKNFDDLREAVKTLPNRKNLSDRDAKMEVPSHVNVLTNARRLNFNMIYWLRSYIPGFRLGLSTERISTREIFERLERKVPPIYSAISHLFLFGWKLIPLNTYDEKAKLEQEENLTLVSKGEHTWLCVMTNEIIPYECIEDIRIYHEYVCHHV